MGRGGREAEGKKGSGEKSHFVSAFTLVREKMGRGSEELHLGYLAVSVSILYKSKWS